MVRRSVTNGAIAGAGIFLIALAMCLVDLWLQPAQDGQLYVFGVTARANGHHSIGVRPAALIWCLAVPLSVAAVASYRRRRRQRVVRSI